MTKFEKRVLAGFLSVMMCLSMIQLPMLNVNAEETVKEEQVRLAETMETENEETQEDMQIVLAGQKNVTKITIPGEEIRYVFKPEKTAGYYLYIRDRGRYNIHESGSDSRSGEGVGKYGIERYFTFQEGKVYYIDISCFGEKETGNVMWGIEEELEVSSGEHKVFISEETHPWAFYRFVPEKEGTYCFHAKGSSTLRVRTKKQSGGQSNTKGVKFCKNLEAGEECQIMISNYSSSDQKPREMLWSITEEEIPEIQAGQRIKVENPEGYEQFYKFTVKESGKYGLSCRGMAHLYVYDEDWDYSSTLSDGDEEKWETGQTYYVKLDTFDVDSETEWSLEKVQDIQVEEGKKYTQRGYQIIDYSFTPQKTGLYLADLESPAYFEIWENGKIVRVMYSSDDIEKVFLEKGKTYCIQLNLYGSPEVSWKINGAKTAESLFYRIKEDGSLEIVGYSGEDSKLLIPEIIDGKQVTSIGEGAFYECENLTEVEFADGIQLKSIGRDAFYGCENLSSIKIPKGLEYLGKNAFSCSGITEIELPDSVTEVEADVFGFCSKLQKVKIGSGLNVIDNYMFNFCESLTQVEFSDKNSVTKIEYNAFRSCSSLQELQIPDSVKALGRNAMEKTAWYEKQEDGVLYLNQILYGYKGEMQKNTELAVKEGIKAVADGAFAGQENLAKAELPEGLEHIGKMSFYNCSSMNAVTVPGSVTRIEEFAFGYSKGEREKDTYVRGDGFYEYVRKMDDFTIYGVSGSAAQQYAEENGFDFVPIAGQIKGDVNGDGTVDDSDLQLVLRAICGKTELTLEQQKAADVEDDGNGVDSEDMRKILRFICGKIEAL